MIVCLYDLGHMVFTRWMPYIKGHGSDRCYRCAKCSREYILTEVA